MLHSRAIGNYLLRLHRDKHWSPAAAPLAPMTTGLQGQGPAEKAPEKRRFLNGKSAQGSLLSCGQSRFRAGAKQELLLGRIFIETNSGAHASYKYELQRNQCEARLLQRTSPRAEA